MKLTSGTVIGTFESPRWGTLQAVVARYNGADGPLAVFLQNPKGELIAHLSVNMHKPECSADSRDLPRNCFYVKDWSENKELAAAAATSGLFKLRNDLPFARSGYVVADVYEVIGGEA